MKQKFPLPHVVKCDTQEVWVKCDSSITAMGLGALRDIFYPGYAVKIASGEYFDKLKNQLAN